MPKKSPLASQSPHNRWTFLEGDEARRALEGGVSFGATIQTADVRPIDNERGVSIHPLVKGLSEAPMGFPSFAYVFSERKAQTRRTPEGKLEVFQGSPERGVIFVAALLDAETDIVFAIGFAAAEMIKRQITEFQTQGVDASPERVEAAVVSKIGSHGPKALGRGIERMGPRGQKLTSVRGMEDNPIARESLRALGALWLTTHPGDLLASWEARQIQAGLPSAKGAPRKPNAGRI